MGLKKYVIGFLVGLVLISAAGSGEAKSQVMDMKVSGDLSQIKAIYVNPIEFSGDDLSDSDRL